MPKRSRSSTKSYRTKSKSKYTKPYTAKPYNKNKRPRVATVARVNRLERMIETKESTPRTGTNVSLFHNLPLIVQRLGGNDLNPFIVNQSVSDPTTGEGSRIGDSVSVKGLMIKGFFENALNRPKVYYRVMLIRRAKGDTIDRSTLFKSDSDNKMIDQVNTERFTVIAQKVFNIGASNYAPSAVDATGQPSINIAGDTRPGIGTRVIKMWIPGYKFGRNGVVQWESNSATQLKFFDYRLVILAYDWYGTPQDSNAVGKINELYMKLYYKDA